MDDLYGEIEEIHSLDEKKRKKRKKRKKAGTESSKESSLRDWFGRKGAKGKKKGWVDCNAPDGKGGYKSCGRSGGEKRKKYPACRPTPGACKERGKGKSWGKKAKKRKNEELYMDLEQMIKEELKQMNEGMGLALMGASLAAAALSGDDSSPEKVIKDTMSDEEKKRIAAELVKKIQQDQGFQELADQWEAADNLKRNKPAAATTTSMADLRKMRADRSKLEEIVNEELEAVLDERRKKKKKKKKKKAKRDACYHKVKSRYKVWPSAYASGALVKCRRVGAKNWGNSKKENLQIMIEDELSQVLFEKKSLKSKVIDALRKEGGAAGMDALEKHTKASKEDISAVIKKADNIKIHEDGDVILMNSLEEALYYGLIEEEEAPTDEQLKNMSPVAAISTLMHHNRSGNDEEDFDAAKDELLGRGVFTREQLQTVKFGDIPDHTGDITNVGTLEEKKKKKKGCKPSKGKKYARRVKGKCVSYGAKGYKIAPGTSKGNSYCARSYGDMKSHGKDCSGKDRSTPLCLSRKKWKCSGKYSRKGK